MEGIFSFISNAVFLHFGIARFTLNNTSTCTLLENFNILLLYHH